MSNNYDRHLKKYGSTPGVVLDESKAGGKIERIQPAPLSEGHVTSAKMSTDDMKEISGANPDLMGQSIQNENESGRAIELRQQQGMKVVEVMFDNFSRTQKLITLGLVDMVRHTDVYSDEEIRNIISEKNMDADLTLLKSRKVGEMTERRTKIKLRGEAKEALGSWHAESRDTDILLGLSGLANAVATITAAAPTSARVFKGGQLTTGVGGVATVATDALIDDTGGIHLFGTLVLSHLKRMAQVDGGASYGKIRPVIIKGKKYYVFFASPWQIKALRSETAWINAQKDANVRGEDNPLFSGAAGMWDGVIVHEYEKIETRTGAGGATASEIFEAADPVASGLTVARGIFCGAQAGILAYGRKIGWREKMFEYESQFGVEVSSIYGFSKAKFNSQDFAVIACDTRVDLDS